MFTKYPGSAAEIEQYLQVSAIPANERVVYGYGDDTLPRHDAYLTRTIRLGEAAVQRGTLIRVSHGAFKNGERWAAIRQIDHRGGLIASDYFTPKVDTDAPFSRRNLAAQGLWSLLVRPDGSRSEEIGTRLSIEYEEADARFNVDYEQLTGQERIIAGG